MMTSEIVGLIPAAGKAERIAPLPCSKEIFPIGFQEVEHGSGKRPKPVCSYLLEKMRDAGVFRAFIVLRSGKWDIPSCLGNGAAYGMNLAYVLIGLAYGVPYTLDQAYPFLRGSRVAFGFPDILFEPPDAFAQLVPPGLCAAEVVLGLFPAGHPGRVDLVDVEADGSVRGIVRNPARNSSPYSWAIAIWTPVFTRFMHEYLASRVRSGAAHDEETTVGDVIDAAIRDGIRVEGRVV
jgi:glucose-1-phosphate thymidylyltransferase